MILIHWNINKVTKQSNKVKIKNEEKKNKTKAQTIHVYNPQIKICNEWQAKIKFQFILTQIIYSNYKVMISTWQYILKSLVIKSLTILFSINFICKHFFWKHFKVLCFHFYLTLYKAYYFLCVNTLLICIKNYKY